jgi:predicted nucleotidyltransferase
MSRVVPARLPPDLARGVDRLVKSGRFANRSEVIKEATRILLSTGDVPPPAAMARSAARLVSLMVEWNMPDAKAIVLFGSGARGEFTSESDIDILVLIGKGTPWKVRKTLYDLIYPVIASLGIDVSLLVVDKKMWLSMRQQGDPLAVSILKEGVLLRGNLEHLA